MATLIDHASGRLTLGGQIATDDDEDFDAEKVRCWTIEAGIKQGHWKYAESMQSIILCFILSIEPAGGW